MNNIFKAFKACKTEEEFEQFMQTTFTSKELEMMDERWRIFNSLAKGTPHRSIASENECSIATVTRGSKAYQANKNTVDKYLKIIFND